MKHIISKFILLGPVFVSVIWVSVLLTHVFIASALAQPINPFVGSKACEECHENEYENYTKYSKMSKSFINVKKLKKGFTPEEYKYCLSCHTTGFGKPGGFRSENETPNLKNLSCESCHGPGGQHIKSEDSADIIGEVSADGCKVCHIGKRVESFHVKPLIYGGVH